MATYLVTKILPKLLTLKITDACVLVTFERFVWQPWLCFRTISTVTASQQFVEHSKCFQSFFELFKIFKKIEHLKVDNKIISH
jgi:hypothetical protein